jgi:phage N-6-adenine-methyltransferase
MTQPILHSIPINAIHKSPYQHRKDFNPDKLNELAKSIERDGLIEPIVVRRNAAGYELIAGERRWRATQITSQSEILARVVEATDLQARRMCAAENMQRQDLGAVEEVYAITELIDAEMIEDDTYSLSAETPTDRVKWLLSRLWSDDRHETNHFAYKFISKIDQIFDSLPRPVEWRSFYNNDFRTITTIDEDVKEIAIHNQLNKSQTKQLDVLKKEAPQAFNDLVRKADGNGRIVIDPLPFDDEDDEPRNLIDLSAREIKAMRYTAPMILIPPTSEPTEVQLGAYDGDEWYTPEGIIDAARDLMGEIDLDPATCHIAQQVIQAVDWYTKEDDGLTQAWMGRVWCNPPYSYPLIEKFTQKAITEFDAGHITDGLLLVNNCTDAAWFVAMAERFPVMFTKGRSKFWQEDQRTFATRQGQAIFYLGPNVERFHSCFAALAYAPLGQELTYAST